MTAKISNKSITPNRLVILRLIAEYRFLTTKQIQRLTDRKWAQQTREDLLRLKQLTLIKSFDFQPERGKTGEHCWLLLEQGARLLQEKGYSVRYNTHYRTEPNRERIAFRDLELELEHQVKIAGWHLIKPQTYNQYNPLPDHTAQYKQLVQAVTMIETKRANPGTKVTTEGSHTLGVPLKMNDYVAYSPDGNKTVVFILHPERGTAKFWQSRLKKYRLLVKDIAIVGLFVNKEVAEPHQRLLKEGKFTVGLVNETIAKGLRNLAQEGQL
jgi:Replication-relaxation